MQQQDNDTVVHDQPPFADKPQRDRFGMFLPGNTIGKAGKAEYVPISVYIKRICSEVQADGRTKAQMIADKMVEMALGGDRTACDMVLDRLEGKAVTPLQHSTISEDTRQLLEELLANRHNGQSA